MVDFKIPGAESFMPVERDSGAAPAMTPSYSGSMSPEQLEFLAAIESLKIPEPEKPGQPGQWETGLRGMGDVLNTYAMTLRGMRPGPGKLNQERIANEQRYHQEKAEAQRYNSELMSQARLMMAKGRLEMKQQKAQAAAEPPEYFKSSKIEDVDGVATNVDYFYDKSDPSKPPIRQVVGDKAYAPYIIGPEPGVHGGYSVPKSGSAAAQPLEGTVAPPPPSGAAQNIAKGEATLKGFERLVGDWRGINKHVKDNKIGEGMFGNLETIFLSGIGETKYGGGFETTEAFNEYGIAVKRSLNKYVKQQTGAQFSIKELDRYVSMWPQAFDREELAKSKIRMLMETASDDMAALLAQYPAAAGQIPGKNVDRFEALGIGRTDVPEPRESAESVSSPYLDKAKGGE